MAKLPEANRFRAHFVELTKHAIEKADTLGKSGHAGLRGLLREIFVADLLKNVIPPEVTIGSGQLTCMAGDLSPQIDIVLYAPSILMPAVYDGKNGFFPTESCLYTIEVKTRITKTSIQRAIASARQVASFSLVQTEHWTAAQNEKGVVLMQSSTPYPIAALFALSSDVLSGPAYELSRYRQLDEFADVRPAISVICIKGVGYWYFDGGWKFLPATDDYDEVVWFLAGISNTLPHFIVAKGRPRLGHYITESTKRFVRP